MKKILCFAIILVLSFTITSCGKEKKSLPEAKIDIEYYAKQLGQIPECEYKLGDSVADIKQELSAKAETAASNGEDFVYTVTEGEQTVQIDNGEVYYYYMKDSEDNGISYIVSLGTSFGFEIGTISIEVKDALSGFDYIETFADDDNAFFIFDKTNTSVMKYAFDNYVVTFVFKDNALCAVAMYDSNYWTL